MLWSALCGLFWFRTYSVQSRHINSVFFAFVRHSIVTQGDIVVLQRRYSPARMAALRTAHLERFERWQAVISKRERHLRAQRELLVSTRCIISFEQRLRQLVPLNALQTPHSVSSTFLPYVVLRTAARSCRRQHALPARRSERRARLCPCAAYHWCWRLQCCLAQTIFGSQSPLCRGDDWWLWWRVAWCDGGHEGVEADRARVLCDRPHNQGCPRA